MKTFQRLILLLSLTGIMFGCSTSTQLRKSWSDPSLANGPVKPFNKVMIIVKAKTDLAKKQRRISLLHRSRRARQFHHILI
jgi:hypothetical protein